MKQRGATFVLAIALFAMGLFLGCKPSVPSKYLSEKEMENLLYDFHLAEAMARQDDNNYDFNLVAYRAAVLKKYGISEADFDSSMVYYMRHTSRLQDIYKRLAERMEDKARELGSSEGALAGLGRASASGDTVDIWHGETSLALIPFSPYNIYTFTYTPDSTFRKGDSFVLACNTDFIFQDGVRDGIVNMAVVYKNDSVASTVLHLSSSSTQSLSIADDDTLGVKRIVGFFLLNKNSQAGASMSTMQLMSVSHIHLFKCRVDKRKAKGDGLAPPSPYDSLSRDSQSTRSARCAKRPGSLAERDFR